MEKAESSEERGVGSEEKKEGMVDVMSSWLSEVTPANCPERGGGFWFKGGGYSRMKVRVFRSLAGTSEPIRRTPEQDVGISKSEAGSSQQRARTSGRAGGS
jgi:hypothetical protein